MKKTVGQRIRELRQEEGLSIKELAERVGVDYNTMRCYEVDKHDPSFRIATRICDVFDISLDWLALGHVEVE